MLHLFMSLPDGRALKKLVTVAQAVSLRAHCALLPGVLCVATSFCGTDRQPTGPPGCVCA